MWVSVDRGVAGPVEEMGTERRSLAHILARLGPSTVLLQLVNSPRRVAYPHAKYPLLTANLPPSITPVTRQISPCPLGMGTFT